MNAHSHQDSSLLKSVMTTSWPHRTVPVLETSVMSLATGPSWEGGPSPGKKCSGREGGREVQGPNGKEGSDPLHLFPEGAGVRGLSSSLMESQPAQGRQQGTSLPHMHTGSHKQQQRERGICSESGARLEVAFLRLGKGLQGRTLKTSPVEDYSEQ